MSILQINYCTYSSYSDLDNKSCSYSSPLYICDITPNGQIYSASFAKTLLPLCSQIMRYYPADDALAALQFTACAPDGVSSSFSFTLSELRTYEKFRSKRPYYFKDVDDNISPLFLALAIQDYILAILR